MLNRIITLDEVDSTNNYLKLNRGELPDGTLVTARIQTAGKGRRGHEWLADQGMLPLSLLLKQPPHPDTLTLCAGVAVCEALEPLLPGEELGIKWPNDIYIGDRKVTGILIENDLMGPYLSRSIIGIGLNVNQTRFDPALPNPTSLAAEAGHPFDRAEVFISFYRHLAERYRTLAGEETGETGKTGKTGPVRTQAANQTDRPDETGGMADGYTQPPTGYDCPSTLDSDYLRLLYRLGQEHLYTDGRTRQQFLGTITGVQPGGELEVRHSADGQLRKYLFKEIEYVIGTPEP